MPPYLAKLRELFTTEELISRGYSAVELRMCGVTAKEIHKAPNRDIILDGMFKAGYSIDDMIETGFGHESLCRAGFFSFF